MTVHTGVPLVLTDAARFLAQYAKHYHAGAFGAPMARDLVGDTMDVRVWTAGQHRTVAVIKRLIKGSTRRDWTGQTFVLPGGSTVVSHVARTPGAPVPSFDEWDYVMAYAEDVELVHGLIAQGRIRTAVRISAASEIIGCWGHRYSGRPRAYEHHDLATITTVPVHVPYEARPVMLAEVAAVNQWHDDYPFYSDGSWSAVSLRGYHPDPRWGVKPSEMPKAWQREHPEAMSYRCNWTNLAEQCPAIRKFVEAVPWWDRLERVRLLQMSGRGGKGGRLGRHTDITDRAAGTHNGQIVRFHVPLVTHPDIVMHGWELDGTHLMTHLRAWQGYYLDARKPHAVDNPTGVDRVHLVVDVLCGEDIRKIIRDAWCDA